MREDIGIYIHIPFCKKKCFYCDFVSFENKEELIEEYINAVCLEILQNAEILSEYNISTIYFGGGTPSFIESKYIVKIIRHSTLMSLFTKTDCQTSHKTKYKTCCCHHNHDIHYVLC